MKKDDWFVNKRCQHFKNATIYMSRSHYTIIEQVQVGLKAERGRKQQQFATIFHLFQQGRPLLEYEALKPFFCFLGILLLAKKHWLDTINWVVVDFMLK